MNIVGSKADLSAQSGTSSEYILDELTDPKCFFSLQYEINKLARQRGLDIYFNGTREVPKPSQAVSEPMFFKNWLDKERKAKVDLLKNRWQMLTEHDPCLAESLKTQNDPSDLNPVPQGKLKSSLEAAAWRNRTVVSKAAIKQYIGFATGGQTIEGPDHLDSKTVVQENLATCYISVYSDGLTDAELAAAQAARPLDSMTKDLLISQEAENCTDISRFVAGDSLEIVKSKITDLQAAEKAYHEGASRAHLSHTGSTDLQGKIEEFVNKHLPIAQSLCPHLIVSKDWSELWDVIQISFINKQKHHHNPLEDAKRLPMFDPNLHNVASFRKNFGAYLAEKQCMSQETHVGTRTLGKLDYLMATTDCFLTDIAWLAKYPAPQGANKETKDATVRSLMQAALINNGGLSNRMLIELRSNSDASPASLFVAIEQEETLLKPKLQSLSTTRVNSVQHSSINDTANPSCAIHGTGHSSDQCKLLLSGKVVLDQALQKYVYTDTRDEFKLRAATDQGPASKKQKTDNKSKEKTKEKNKSKNNKQTLQASKDKKKKTEKDTKKKNVKFSTALADLKTTIVSVITQSHTPSSSSSSATSAIPVAPSQDAALAMLLDKKFADFGKALGIEP